MTKIVPPDTFYVKYSKFQIFRFFYKRSYQSREFQNVITSEPDWTMTFSKKPLFLFMNSFQISSTWFIWPWPPYRLKIAFHDKLMMVNVVEHNKRNILKIILFALCPVLDIWRELETSFSHFAVIWLLICRVELDWSFLKLLNIIRGIFWK